MVEYIPRLPYHFSSTVPTSVNRMDEYLLDIIQSMTAGEIHLLLKLFY